MHQGHHLRKVPHKVYIRYVGIIQLFYLIKHLYLIGVCHAVKQGSKTKHHKDTCIKKVALSLQNKIELLHGEHNWEDLCV